jgi:hypothetical protein
MQHIVGTGAADDPRRIETSIPRQSPRATWSGRIGMAVVKPNGVQRFCRRGLQPWISLADSDLATISRSFAREHGAQFHDPVFWFRCSHGLGRLS